MNPMELVSVIVPVFNGAETLEQCVQSLCAQTYDNLEILIIDDGSGDRTLALAKALSERDARVHLFATEHRGVSHARNTGLDHANGTYLCFLDADDTVPPEFVSTLVKALESSSAGLCFCGCYVDGDPYPVRNAGTPLLDREAALFLLFSQSDGYSFAVWNKIFRRDVVGDLRFDESLHYLEDGVFVCSYLLKTEQMMVLPEPLCNHFRREGSLSRNLTPGEERLSALRSRKRMMDLAAPVSFRLKRIARARYLEGALFILFDSYLAGFTKEVLAQRDHLKPYYVSFFLFDPIPLTQKVRYAGYLLILKKDLGLRRAKQWESLRRKNRGGAS